MLGPGPIVTQPSGGLDSSFVAASLLRHATAHDPVQALCRSPTPEAQLAPEARWDPDDYPVARTMEDAYPGLIVVHRVHPRRRGTRWRPRPSHRRGRGSHLQPWQPGVDQPKLNGLAAELGANRLFTGAWGNASFSYDHDYATGYYVRRGHLGAAWRSLALNRHGLPSRTALRNRVRAPLVGILRHALTPDAADWLRRHLLRREGSSTAYPSLIGLGYLGTDAAFPRVNRSEYLKWLAGAGPLGMAAMFSAQRVPAVDPFTTAQVRTLAAAITPWNGPAVLDREAMHDYLGSRVYPTPSGCAPAVAGSRGTSGTRFGTDASAIWTRPRKSPIRRSWAVGSITVP